VASKYGAWKYGALRLRGLGLGVGGVVASLDHLQESDAVENVAKAPDRDHLIVFAVALVSTLISTLKVSEDLRE